jgi:hypothetical protein
MKEYVKNLPKRSEINELYEKERDLYRMNHSDEKFINLKPYRTGGKLGLLGRDNEGRVGDFVSVSQYTWDNVRLRNLEAERPQGPAYDRAVAKGGVGLDQETRDRIEKKAKLEAMSKEQSGTSGPADAASALVLSLEEGKRVVKQPPQIHKPFPWDPNNPSDGIPWPDVECAERSNGPAYERKRVLKNLKASPTAKVYDPFTGTYILPIMNERAVKVVKLNYEPSKNAYVSGDALSGLRSQKRHKRIVQASNSLAETRMTPEQREAIRKAEAKQRADLELAKARENVRQRKLFQAQMRAKLDNMEALQKGTRYVPRPSTAPEVSMKSILAHKQQEERESQADILVIDHGEEAEAEVPVMMTEADMEQWEGTRVKTPVWSGWGSRTSSAGHTPFNRENFSREKFAGWLGGLVRGISRSGSRGANAGGGETGDDDNNVATPAAAAPPMGLDGTTPQPSPVKGSSRPDGRRSKNRKERGERGENADGLGGLDASPERSLEGSLGMGSLGSAGSFEFLEDVSLDDEHSSPSRKKKKKKKKKKEYAEDGHLSDDDVSLLSLESLETPSKMDTSVGGRSRLSPISMGDSMASTKKSKKKKKKSKERGEVGDDLSDEEVVVDEESTIHSSLTKKREAEKQKNLSNYINGPVATFEFIDDLSLASSMGTVKNKKGRGSKRGDRGGRKRSSSKASEEGSLGGDVSEIGDSESRDGGSSVGSLQPGSPSRRKSGKQSRSKRIPEEHDSDLSSLGSTSLPWTHGGEADDDHSGVVQSGENEMESEFVVKKALAIITEDSVDNTEIAKEMLENEKKRRVKSEEPEMTEEEEAAFLENEMKMLEQGPEQRSLAGQGVDNTVVAASKSFGVVRSGTNKVFKYGARFESMLIRKGVWPKKWRISGRGNYNKSNGFLLAANDPLMQGQNITTRILYTAYLGANKAFNATAYASYLCVYAMGGADAASTMGLRDFLFKRSVSVHEMIAAAGDAERTMVVRALTQMKDQVPVDSRDHTGRTALMIAVDASCKALSDAELRDWSRSQRKQRTVRFLRGRGKTPESSEVIANMRAVKYERVLEVLIAKGSDINAKCIGHVDEDVTPLHIASINGSVHRIKWLLAKGALVNCKTESGMTPLHFAAKSGHLDVATYLLKQDANMIARNSIGWTPLHFAACSGGTKMVRLLLMAGADKQIEDEEERTPALVAKKYGNMSSFEVLRKWADEEFKAKEALDFLKRQM